MYSVETSGTFDLDAELKLWIGSNHAAYRKEVQQAVLTCTPCKVY